MSKHILRQAKAPKKKKKARKKKVVNKPSK